MPLTRTAPPVVALVLGLLLTGCSGADGGDTAATQRGDRDRPRASVDLGGAEQDRPTETPTGTPTEAPSASPTRDPAASPGSGRTIAEPRTPRPRPNALSVRTVGPDGHLIGPAALGPRWRGGATRDEGEESLSPCHRGTMADTGASRTRLREFDGPGRAVQAVSQFVDRKSAWRVERVVAAWAEDCAAELRRRDAALGAVRHGRWLSVVEVAGVAAPRQQLARALAAVERTF